MFNATDEDLFQPPTSGSNLASLFGASMSVSDESNQSLIYTAPKQPKANEQEIPKPKVSATQTSLCCVKAVDLYKLQDGKQLPQGKFGLALIGNENLKAFEIIIYKTRDNILTRASINEHFSFTLYCEFYASFDDNNKQQWIVNFESHTNALEFANEIKKHNANVIIDKTTAKPVISIKQKPEEKLVNVNGGKSNECDKDSDIQSDSSGCQTRASILSRMAKMGHSVMPSPLTKKNNVSDTESDNDKISSKKPARKQKKNHMSSERSDELQTISPTTSQNCVLVNGQYIPIETVSPLNTSQAMSLQPVPYINYNQAASFPNQLMLGQQQISTMSDPLNIFIAENRTHNCELRMNLSQLSSKLDQVLDKVHRSESSNTTAEETILKSKIKALEFKNGNMNSELEKNYITICELKEREKMLVNELKSKNETSETNLKQTNENLNKIILEMDDKIAQLQNENLLFIEQNKLKDAELQEVKNNYGSEVAKLSEDKNVKIIELEQLCNTLIEKQEFTNSEKQKIELFTNKLRHSMNLMYQQLVEQFQDENVTFKTKQIQSILASNIKSTTFKLVTDFQNDFKCSNLNFQKD